MKIKKSDFNTKIVHTIFDQNVGSSHKGDGFITYATEMNKLFINGEFDLDEVINTVDFKSNTVNVSNYEYPEITLSRITCLGMVSLNESPEVKCFIDLHPGGVEGMFNVAILVTSTGYLVNGIYKI